MAETLGWLDQPIESEALGSSYPKATACLSGLTPRQALELAARLGCPVDETRVRLLGEIAEQNPPGSGEFERLGKTAVARLMATAACRIHFAGIDAGKREPVFLERGEWVQQARARGFEAGFDRWWHYVRAVKARMFGI